MPDPRLEFRSWQRLADGSTESIWHGTQYTVQQFDADYVPRIVATFDTEATALEYVAWKGLDRVLITEDRADKTVRCRTVYQDAELEERLP